MEIVENGKETIKREQALTVDAAVDDQLSLWGLYDLGDISSGHGKRQRVGDDDDDDDHSVDDEEYFRNLPLGYGFYPEDDVLIEEYLKPKLFNQPLPRNLINDIDIYLHSPDFLAETYKHCGCGDEEDDEDQIKEWYYFTPRYRKYPKGNRPRRSAGDGYWKATGRERQIKDKVKNIIGFWKTLVFFKGKPPMGQKTNWIMREYRLNNPPPLRPTNDIMKLDDCVLCRMYKKKVYLNESKSKSPIKGKDPKKVATKSTTSLSNGAPQQSELIDPPPSFDRSYHVGESSTSLPPCNSIGAPRQSQLIYQHSRLDQSSTSLPPPYNSIGARAPQLPQDPANESEVVFDDMPSF
ncbi:NAC domain-containing protein 1-like [Corylus avellana]|uniref:NAC domain-containing protein 1-like n=1 Tax=Corylus avellana TaxID=13451 RepID=UPI00286C36F6|nr:NAC domain-containing protein 1-like [Corylus avellana]XP_059430179.1 NAC domain-containing protein 1-like [Corylus avellana]